jgi:hypothetical protein
MKNSLRKRFIALGLCVSPFLLVSPSFAQNTAFTYQCLLKDGGSPANGIYDLRCTIFDAGAGMNQIGNALTNSAVSVSNGLFAVVLDFGNVFDGGARWLEIAVRTNGDLGDFTTLLPRQAITSTPYAIQSLNAASATVAASANSISAANISGTIAPAQLPASVLTNGASGVNISGTFTGNGAGVTNIAVSSVGPAGTFSLLFGTYFPLSSNYVVGNKPSATVVVDVNGDGKPDLVTANTYSNSVTVLTNNGSGLFGVSANYPVGANPEGLAAADLNGDGKVDLVTANANDQTLTILTNNGAGIFGSNATINVSGTSPIPVFVAAADINGDGKPDLLVLNNNSGSLMVFTNNGSGIFGSNTVYALDNGPIALAVTDVNGDGTPDIVTANEFSSTLMVFTNNSSGALTFIGRYSLAGGGGANWVAAADVNGDGKVDLISANFSAQTLSVLTNNGNGVFSSPVNYSVGKARSIVAADVNGDNKVDLIAGVDVTSGGSLVVLTNKGNGLFSVAVTNAVGVGPYGYAADLNSDGLTDLVSANFGANTLTVLLQAPRIVSPAALVFNNSADIFNGSFSGNGAGITNIPLNALQILPLTNNQTGVTLGGAFSGNGGALTNINAANLTNAIADARLSANVPLLNRTNVFARTNWFTGVTIATNANNQFAGIFSGDGSGLTNLNANAVSDGLTTNLTVLAPDGSTNVLVFTNGILKAVQ